MINIYIILSLSLNLLIGYIGLLSLAHVAFYGIGAYITTLLMMKLGLNFFMALPIAILFSAVISLSIEPSKITSLMGPNGAGKTTLFNLISGYLNPDKGVIRYTGEDIIHLSPWQRAGLGIGRMFQDIRVFGKLTVIENLMVADRDPTGENPFTLFWRTQKIKKREKERLEMAERWLEFVGLTDHRTMYAENLSYGQQKLLALARLLYGDFKLFLIDEPVSGVNPKMIGIILKKIRELTTLEKTVVLVEHNMTAVKEIADVVNFMDEGKILS